MSVSPSDVVFVDSLQLSANIGPDCWGRLRAQPILLSLYLHLRPSYLSLAAKSDDVRDSVHYGHLSKAISILLEDPAVQFSCPRELISAVARRAFEVAGADVAEVRVVVDVPKFILLAAGSAFDVTIPAALAGDVLMKFSVSALVLAVVIGVNPPERKAKQRVITSIDFFEEAGVHPPVDYPLIVADIAKDIEASSYLTLEKFAMEIIRKACFSSDSIRGVTVRAQKPSAIVYARSSGVEISRERTSLGSS